MKRSIGIAILLVAVACPVMAGELVPFSGTWHGQTISAEFQPPNIVFVVASGTGQLTHLGEFTMVSPHYNSLPDFKVWGEQIFTAADGSVLHATIDGQLAPTSDGNVAGTLAGTITGGSGRFEGATGSYAFALVARPIPGGFDTIATFDGAISSVGSTK